MVVHLAPRFCREHKKEGMVKKEGRMCVHLDCETEPCFNKKGSRWGKLCGVHMLEGMVDVEHKTCQYPERDSAILQCPWQTAGEVL